MARGGAGMVLVARDCAHGQRWCWWPWMVLVARDGAEGQRWCWWPGMVLVLAARDSVEKGG